MTAHLFKRGAADARLTFRCPWCDVVCASAVLGVHEHRADAWLLVACAHFACGRGHHREPEERNPSRRHSAPAPTNTLETAPPSKVKNVPP